MEPTKEVYGYVIRYREGKPQVLALRSADDLSAFQFPRGEVREQEDTYTKVIDEVKEQTGIEQFEMTSFVTDDIWKSETGKVYHRFFYKLLAYEEEEELSIPDGSWITCNKAPVFQQGHGDYLSRIL